MSQHSFLTLSHHETGELIYLRISDISSIIQLYDDPESRRTSINTCIGGKLMTYTVKEEAKTIVEAIKQSEKKKIWKIF